MYRAEIIANRSVQEEITETLERMIPEILYSIIPEVYGKGKNNRKLGTVSWPEINFILIAYVEDTMAPVIHKVITDIKKRFPKEGIKLFMIPCK
jgi:ribosome recycling factor